MGRLFHSDPVMIVFWSWFGISKLKHCFSFKGLKQNWEEWRLPKTCFLFICYLYHTWICASQSKFENHTYPRRSLSHHVLPLRCLSTNWSKFKITQASRCCTAACDCTTPLKTRVASTGFWVPSRASNSVSSWIRDREKDTPMRPLRFVLPAV